MQVAETQKTLLLFGYHSRELARNWILEEGLSAEGFRILECRTQKKGFLPKYIDLTKQYWRMRSDIDIILVTFMGYYFMPLAWILARLTRKKLIFDGLISLYESEVHDRKRLSTWNPFAWMLWLLDWFSYRFADLTLLESPVYQRVLAKHYHLSEKRFLPLPVGCRSDIFRPATEKKTHEGFRVMYQGAFIPIHGVETILEAAKEIEKRGLSDITFDLVGKGQTEKEMKRYAEKLELQNVTFHGYLQTLDDVAEMLRNADVGFGMFQESEKADSCMPHKVYEVLASRVPLIMIDSTASREMLRGDIALFVPAADPTALADAIIRLRDDASLRESIAENGHQYFQEHFQPTTIVKPLIHYLKTK